jgi:hypothetical protein
MIVAKEEEFMLTKEGLEFITRTTDWMHGHWEDPEWGKRSFAQLQILLAVHTMASGIADATLRKSIQGAVEKATVGLSRKVAAASSQDPVPPNR